MYAKKRAARVKRANARIENEKTEFLRYLYSHFPIGRETELATKAFPLKYFSEFVKFEVIEFPFLSMNNPFVEPEDVFRHRRYTILRMSENPKLRTVDLIRFIRKYPYLKRNVMWNELSGHRDVTLEMVRECDDMPWGRAGLSSNPNLTYDFIKESKELKHIRGSWEPILIANNDAISYKEYCMLFGEYYREWCIRKEDYPLEKLLEPIRISYKNFSESAHKKITLEIAKKHRLNLTYFSKNPNLTPAILKDNAGLAWNGAGFSVDGVSRNGNFKYEDFDDPILKRFFYPSSFCGNPNLTIEVLRKSGKWDWFVAAVNPAISGKDILDNMDLPWGWSTTSVEKVIRYKFDEIQTRIWREENAAFLITHRWRNMCASLTPGGLRVQMHRITDAVEEEKTIPSLP